MADRNCRSTLRIACIARHATSRSRTRGRSPGRHPRVVRVRTTRACRNRRRLSYEPKPIAARLREDIAAHRLEFDSGQEQAAARLDELRAQLSLRSQSWGHRLRAWFPSPLNRAAATPVRGLYLWGGVGRGKTLLMDLFYESLPAGLSVRTHFYRFMRDVHAQLNSIKR